MAKESPKSPPKAPPSPTERGKNSIGDSIKGGYQPERGQGNPPPPPPKKK